MKADNSYKTEEISEVKGWVRKWEQKGFRKHIIDNFPYLLPPLINRTRCFTYSPDEGCLYCSNKTFRYYSKSGNKKYYQCEKCGGINH